MTLNHAYDCYLEIMTFMYYDFSSCFQLFILISLNYDFLSHNLDLFFDDYGFFHTVMSSRGNIYQPA